MGEVHVTLLQTGRQGVFGEQNSLQQAASPGAERMAQVAGATGIQGASPGVTVLENFLDSVALEPRFEEWGRETVGNGVRAPPQASAVDVPESALQGQARVGP